MQPINKQICHFCVAGDLIFRNQGIVKIPILTVDPNTNNILDMIELFCKGEAATLLKSLNFKKGDYGYCEGSVTFSRDKPSDIAPIVLEKLAPGTIKFKNLNYDEANNVLYTFIKDKRFDYDNRGNIVMNWGKKTEAVSQSQPKPKIEVTTIADKNYHKRQVSLQSRIKSLFSENDQ